VRNSRPSSNYSVSQWVAMQKTVGCGKNVLTTPALQPLLSLKRHGRSAKVNTREIRVREGISLFAVPVVAPSSSRPRLPRGARRTWRSLGCPDRRGAWTNKAGADRYPSSFLYPARISENSGLDYEDARKASRTSPVRSPGPRSKG